MTRVTGHFGEWFQGRTGPDGPVVLVTMTCDALGVNAKRLSDGAFSVDGSAGLDGAVAAKFFAALGVPLPTGRFDVSSDALPGSGVGVSTASLLALAAAAGVKATPADLAAAALAAEKAVDPLMLAAPDCCLWASREACVVRETAVLPVFEVVAGFWGAPERTDAADDRFPDVADLAADWDAARGDPLALARIASISADRTTALRGPCDDPTSELAIGLAALGHARAHTGSARALLFNVDAVPPGAEGAMQSAGYADVFRFRTGGV